MDPQDRPPSRMNFSISFPRSTFAIIRRIRNRARGGEEGGGFCCCVRCGGGSGAGTGEGGRGELGTERLRLGGIRGGLCLGVGGGQGGTRGDGGGVEVSNRFHYECKGNLVSSSQQIAARTKGEATNPTIDSPRDTQQRHNNHRSLNTTNPKSRSHQSSINAQPSSPEIPRRHHSQSPPRRSTKFTISLREGEDDLPPTEGREIREKRSGGESDEGEI